MSTEFKEYLKREGIRHELTIPKTPEQNVVAEKNELDSYRNCLIDVTGN